MPRPEIFTHAHAHTHTHTHVRTQCVIVLTTAIYASGIHFANLFFIAQLNQHFSRGLYSPIEIAVFNQGNNFIA